MEASDTMANADHSGESVECGQDRSFDVVLNGGCHVEENPSD